MSDPVTLALIGMVGAIVTGFFKMIDTQNKNQKELTKAVDALSRNSEKQTAASLEIAKETKQGNIEAKERNGHLGEQNIEIAKLVNLHNKDVTHIKESNATIAKILSKSAIIAAEDREILTGSLQIVEEQTVVHQTVKNKE